MQTHNLLASLLLPISLLLSTISIALCCTHRHCASFHYWSTSMWWICRNIHLWKPGSSWPDIFIQEAAILRTSSIEHIKLEFWFGQISCSHIFFTKSLHSFSIIFSGCLSLLCWFFHTGYPWACLAFLGGSADVMSNGHKAPQSTNHSLLPSLWQTGPWSRGSAATAVL